MVNNITSSNKKILMICVKLYPMANSNNDTVWDGDWNLGEHRYKYGKTESVHLTVAPESNNYKG